MNINEYIKRKSGKAHAPQMTPEEAVAKYAGMDPNRANACASSSTN